MSPFNALKCPSRDRNRDSHELRRYWNTFSGPLTKTPTPNWSVEVQPNRTETGTGMI